MSTCSADESRPNHSQSSRNKRNMERAAIIAGIYDNLLSLELIDPQQPRSVYSAMMTLVCNTAVLPEDPCF